MSSSYDETYFEELYQVEDRHFWFRARQAFVAALCEQAIAGRVEGYRVMEIGCGTGHLLRTLERTCHGGQVFGLDLFWEGLAFARQRSGALLIQGQAEQMPFAAGQFELIGMFDVLEHLEHDEEMLRAAREMLKKDGKILLTVPAEKQLWSTTDLLARHQRRYELADLEEKLARNGFHVEYISKCMQVLHPLARLRRKAPILLETMSADEESQSRREFSQELAVIPLLNEIAYQLLKTETRKIKKHKAIARGTSIIALASRG
jgi:ubiquinone/menaquinone biosynthesis C-methylase UbiE